MASKNNAFGFRSFFTSKLEDTDATPLDGIGATWSATTDFQANGKQYVVFQSSGSLTVSRGGSVDVLVIGGGGGAGASSGYVSYYYVYQRSAGGGGAGGVRNLYNEVFGVGTYTISVGGGGSGQTISSNARGVSGTPTYISSPALSADITANGGGGGGAGTGSYNQTVSIGLAGGSGGGGGQLSPAVGGAGNTPSYFPSQGYPGGSYGGGGGGASGPITST